MGCSHDHQKEWQIYEKSTDEKLKAADRFRQEGNDAFKKHNYGLAAVHYRKALLQFDYTFAEGPDEEKRHDDLKERCLLNLAACKCQQEEWDDVLTHCRLALELNPRSVKAYYRTGLAHMARDGFELAKEAFLSAHEIEPTNAETNGALKQLQKNMAHYKTKRKEVAKEMLSGKEVPTAEESAADATESTHVKEEVGKAELNEAAPTPGAAAAEPTSKQEEEEVEEETTAPLAAAPETPQEPSEPSSSSGMRQRRAPAVTAAAPAAAPAAAAKEEAARTGYAEDEEPEGASQKEKDLDAVEGNVLKLILVAAGGLGLLAALAGGIAVMYSDG